MAGNLFTRLQYSKTWENAADFPTHEYSEGQVRADAQRLFDEIQNYVNTVLLPQMEHSLRDYSASGAGGGAPAGDEYLLRSGGQMTGPLLLYADPEYITEAATKQYVDNLSALIKTGLEGQIAGITVDLDRIEAVVADGIGNVSQVTMTPEQIAATVQDALGNIAGIKMTADEIIATVEDAIGNGSGLDMTPEQIHQWVKDSMGNIADLIMQSDEIKALVRNTAGDESSVTLTPEQIELMVKNAEDEFSRILQTSDMIQGIVQNKLGEMTSIMQTSTDIRALAERVTGESAEVSITPDDITLRVKDALQSEAVMSILSDKISQMVRDEVSGKQASLELTAEGIQARVQNAVGDMVKAQLTASGFDVELANTLRGTAAGQNMTDEQIQLWVQGQINEIAKLIINSNSVKAAVESEAGSGTMELTDSSFGVKLDNLNDKIAEFMLTDTEIKQSIKDKLSESEAELSLTPEQIDAMVSKGIDQYAKTAITSDSVKAIVKEATNKYALLELLSDSIKQMVSSEVKEAGQTVDENGLRLWAKTYTDGKIDKLSEITVKSDMLGLLVQNEMRQAGMTMTDDQVRAFVEEQDGLTVEQILNDDGLLQRMADGMGREAIVQIMQEELQLSVSNAADGDNATIAVNLQVGDQNKRGTAVVTGDVNVSGNLSAEALIAQRGDVAHMTVDALSTARLPARYLAADTSDVNFLRMKDQHIELVAGIYQSGASPVQFRDPNGNALYWQEAVLGLSTGPDGYPRNAAGQPVLMTATVTQWPVMCYQYIEQVKASWSFGAAGNGIYEPAIVLGAGNAAGGNKARIYKGTEGLEIRYTTPANSEIGIHMTTDGKVKIDGLAQESVLAALSGSQQGGAASADVQSAVGIKRAAALDFSGWDSGSFTETLEGEGAARTYGVGFDELGRPTSISDASGNTLSITW